MTEYDKLKNMEVEEMAEYLSGLLCNDNNPFMFKRCSTHSTCRECWLDYLNQEAEE